LTICGYKFLPILATFDYFLRNLAIRLFEIWQHWFLRTCVWPWERCIGLC